jgi:hypothetical protein
VVSNLTEFSVYNTGADAVTGERIFPGESVLDTNINNVQTPYMGDMLTRFVKENTIVWLAEQAGYTLTKRDAGDSGDTEGVDGTDAIVGGGEGPVGEAPSGGSKATKRRSSGTIKD